ncbi:Protein of unknown function [Gryllus bimaculatus]|nr:Protein of unknown function [Gryllus bimaculatus]
MGMQRLRAASLAALLLLLNSYLSFHQKFGQGTARTRSGSLVGDHGLNPFRKAPAGRHPEGATHQMEKNDLPKFMNYIPK